MRLPVQRIVPAAIAVDVEQAAGECRPVATDVDAPQVSAPSHATQRLWIARRHRLQMIAGRDVRQLVSDDGTQPAQIEDFEEAEVYQQHGGCGDVVHSAAGDGAVAALLRIPERGPVTGSAARPPVAEHHDELPWLD